MMERDKLKEPANILAARPNGRSTAPLVVNRNGPRRSLFTSLEPKGDRVAEDVENAPMARPVSSASSSDRGTASPRTTKIPRPAQLTHSSGRRPFSLKDAYRIATREEDDVAQGSPSPAPRSWRSRTTSKENRAPNSPSKGSPKQGWRRRGATTSTESLGREDNGSSVEASESDFDQKLKQFDKDQLRRGQIDSKNAISSTQKLGPKVTRTGTQLSRKASIGSLDGASPSRGYQPWGVKAKSSRGWLKRVIASPETDDANQEPEGQPPMGRDADVVRGSPNPLGLLGTQSPPPTPTPKALRDAGTLNRSFAWQADEDFTAGDLQISESPPVKVGMGDNQFDKIRTSEPKANEQAFDSTRSKSRNTRLDEIRALEIEAAMKFPDEAPDFPDDEDGMQEKNSDEEGLSPRDRHIGRTNTRIDEIRAREIETLSKRALATARLDEIRERNAEFRSRSSSPELARKPSRDLLSEPTLSGDDIQRTSHDSRPKEDGEQIPNTPVTVFKKPVSDPPTKVGDGTTGGSSQSTRGSSIPRSDSHGLLRQLARAASTSPSSEQQVPEDDVKDSQRAVVGPEKSDTESSRRERRPDRTAEDTKPRVGFAGLRREPSIESTSDKRLSFAASDSDPTERIERELQLFAPMDNHSERGSLRAPSPDEDEECPEETPRPTKPDPLTQPTPRVTGAYVETPVTIKVEKVEGAHIPEIVEPGQSKPASGIPPVVRGRRAESSSPRKPVHSLSANGDREATRSSSLLRGRRSKSLPRVRSPLINSATPPTVKGDLLEIHRAHQIEDSTLDDFSELLAGHTAASPPATARLIVERFARAQKVLTDAMSEDDTGRELSNHKEELEAFARMNKALNAGLHDIRTAKRGIERLEDKVSHPEIRPTSEALHVAHANHANSPTCATCLGHDSHSSSGMVTYVRLPVPRLWRREPRFKFTFLGFIIFMLSCWYIAESAMCFFYCKPESCYPGQPCDWSHDDPFWGYSIPVKLDQWTTGGKGRTLASRLETDIADWKADLWDAITGTDFTEADTASFNWDQRRQHRRRLMKRGLIKPLVELPEDRAKHEAWRSAAAAKETADAMREMGYNTDDDESMTVDEKVSGW